MTQPFRPQCDTCGKVMSRNQAVMKTLPPVLYVACVDCALDHLEEDDAVTVSVDLLRRIRDGVL